MRQIELLSPCLVILQPCCSAATRGAGRQTVVVVRRALRSHRVIRDQFPDADARRACSPSDTETTRTAARLFAMPGVVLDVLAAAAASGRRDRRSWLACRLVRVPGLRSR